MSEKEVDKENCRFLSHFCVNIDKLFLIPHLFITFYGRYSAVNRADGEIIGLFLTKNAVFLHQLSSKVLPDQISADYFVLSLAKFDCFIEAF